MISDTLWQKYIYNTPFDDDEMPLLNSRKSIINGIYKTINISGKSLYSYNKKDFLKLCNDFHNNDYLNVIIDNDYEFESNNSILINSAKAHMLSFCYLFQENGFNCIVNKLDF